MQIWLISVHKRKIYIFAVAMLLGIFIVLQINSFTGVNDLILRDNASNVFREIAILKEKNRDLSNEIKQLELAKEQLSDKESALDLIADEIIRYKKLTGGYSIFGPGVVVSINGDFSTPWMTDLINEIFNSGAEAVSINGIRITNSTVGLDTLPHGQILINGSILAPPYVFKAIGESSTMNSILSLPGGIFDRIRANFKDTSVEVLQKDVIHIE